MTHMIFDIETTSLEPCEGIVTCIAYCLIDKKSDQVGEVHSLMNSGRPGGECQLLTGFMAALSNLRVDTLEGFNALKFDWPWLMYRCGTHGIPMRRPRYLTDTREKACGSVDAWGTLDDVAFEFNVPHDDRFTGKDAALAWDDPSRRPLIEAHCRDDVLATAKIALKCSRSVRMKELKT